MYTAPPEIHIAVIGLGYVGLPLAAAFAERFKVTGFDINQKRVDELGRGKDSTLQLSEEELKASHLQFSTSAEHISHCNIYIITVPTPVDESKKPDLKPLLAATASVGKVLSKGDLVIYESTVYPGCTEEDCVPLLEKTSQLKYNTDFFCGYSPERISPGDPTKALKTIVKVTSGSSKEAADFVDHLYSQIIDAGTFKARSIKVAEASKAIENAQRDVNISFVNELALMFDKLGIDTTDVLEAASTKWNFLRFKPGLVGGHCIGVDPYYLAYKAELAGYHPEVILSGRKVNDYMPTFVASKVVKLMLAKGIAVKGSKALILGVTFKENCPDVRNTKVVEICNELREYGVEVDIHDPWADPMEVHSLLHTKLVDDIYSSDYQAIILAVAHEQFREIDFEKLKMGLSVIFDTKSVLPQQLVDGRL